MLTTELQKSTHPMVVMKEEVKESSEKRSNKQLFPTPASRMNDTACP